MKKLIMFEKECTEEYAEWMVDRIESLVSHMPEYARNKATHNQEG